MARTREGNGNWTGDRASYAAAHNRHRQRLPKECMFESRACSGKFDVALLHSTPIERLLGAVGGKTHGMYFSLSVDDYVRLCQAHHRRYDAIGRRFGLRDIADPPGPP